MYYHDRHRCLRHPGDGPAQLRVGARPGSASAAATERQRAVLPLRPARFLARGARHDAHPRQALSPDDAGQDRALPPLHEEPDPARELLSARSARTAPGRVRRLLQLAEVPRKSQQPNPGRCLLRSWSNHPDTEGKHLTENHRATTPAASPDCSFNFNSDGPDPLLNPLLTCPKGSDDVHFPPSRFWLAIQPAFAWNKSTLFSAQSSLMCCGEISETAVTALRTPRPDRSPGPRDTAAQDRRRRQTRPRPDS